MFWIALAIDYLPVLFGFSELSIVARAILLVVAGVMVGYVIYRLVLARIFVSLKNTSLALLIERKYPQFSDSLLTTVNQVSTNSEDINVDAAMLERTRVEAESFVPEVELKKVVSARPMNRSLTLAGVLLASVVGLVIANPRGASIAAERLVLLKDKPWPRRCLIELVGIKIKRENPVEGIEELGQTLTLTNSAFRVARGSTLTLMVRAEGTQDESDRRLPANCSLIYETKNGNGVQNFKRIGVPRDGFQLYSLDGQPFRGILDKITFYVRGGDHRIGPFNIEVVEPPDVSVTQLAVKYPPYVVDGLRYSDRTLNWSGQARFPEGTSVTIQATANKPLKKVYALDRQNNEMNVLDADGLKFSFPITSLRDPVSIQFFLCDVDNLVSEQPHTVNIEPIEDQPPIVQTRLTGIGTAVTPDVQIPISGKVSDDHGLSRTWIEIDVAETDTLEEPIVIGEEGEIETLIDFKQRRQDVGQKYQLPTDERSTVSIVIRSEDRFDLDEEPNLGVGDKYTLDVVTPNELIRILERLEVGQRRRLEQIYLELADARNYLMRSKSERIRSRNTSDGLVEPGDGIDESAESGESDEEPELRKQELRLLFSQRAILQVDKSTQEILGSAEAFESIRLQLINNRIDSEDRKNRFSEQIIAPLRLIGNQSMRQLKDEVVELEVSLRDLQLNALDVAISTSANSLAESAIAELDLVLNQLDGVLNVLIKYETQNELLELVRQMIKQQQALKERTKKERQRKAFEGLLD